MTGRPGHEEEAEVRVGPEVRRVAGVEGEELVPDQRRGVLAVDRRTLLRLLRLGRDTLLLAHLLDSVRLKCDSKTKK